MKSHLAFLPNGTTSQPYPQWQLWMTPESVEEKEGLKSLMNKLVTPRFIGAGFTHAGEDTALISWPAN